MSESELLSILSDSKFKKELTAKKTAELLESKKYVVTGFVITDVNGDIGIVDKSAVRWLDKHDFFSMMHENELQKYKSFVNSLLHPEEYGYAVTAEVRDQARILLGMNPVESKLKK